MARVDLPFRDRTEAGISLAAELARFQNLDDVLVVALPRGGVPVACEIALALRSPLDVLIVRKLGVPWQEELAMGAVASGGVRLLNPGIVSDAGISSGQIEEATRLQLTEIERREKAYRGSRPQPEIRGKRIILVDDGIATGATMRVAVRSLRERGASAIVVAVPVAPAETVDVLRGEADEVVCLATPEPFCAVGTWYADFRQVSDAEVRRQLDRAWHEAPR